MSRAFFCLGTVATLLASSAARGDWIMEYWIGPGGSVLSPANEPLTTPPYFRTGNVIYLHPMPGYEDNIWGKWNLGAIFALNGVNPAQDDADGDGLVDFAIEHHAPNDQSVWTYTEADLSWSDVAQWQANPTNDFFSLGEPDGALADHSPPVPGLWSFSFYCEGQLVSTEHAVITPEPAAAALLLLGISIVSLRRRKGW